MSELVGWAKRSVPTTAVSGGHGAKIAPLPTLHLRLLRDRHRSAGDLQVDRAKMHAAGEEQRLPIAAAEPEVRGRGLSVDHAGELLCRGIEDVEAARSATKAIAGDVDLHAVGHA